MGIVPIVRDDGSHDGLGVRGLGQIASDEIFDLKTIRLVLLVVRSYKPPAHFDDREGVIVQVGEDGVHSLPLTRKRDEFVDVQHARPVAACIFRHFPPNLEELQFIGFSWILARIAWRILVKVHKAQCCVILHDRMCSTAIIAAVVQYYEFRHAQQVMVLQPLGYPLGIVVDTSNDAKREGMLFFGRSHLHSKGLALSCSANIRNRAIFELIVVGSHSAAVKGQRGLVEKSAVSTSVKLSF